MNQYCIAYTEILDILNHMDSKYISKLPESLINYLNTNKDNNYSCNIDYSIPLKANNLNHNTLIILAMLLINFWCETEEEKQELIDIYFQNEQEYQKTLNEKYDPNLMFKSSNAIPNSNIDSNVISESGTIEITDLNNSISTYTSLKWYQKIIYKIKNLFKK